LSFYKILWLFWHTFLDFGHLKVFYFNLFQHIPDSFSVTLIYPTQNVLYNQYKNIWLLLKSLGLNKKWSDNVFINRSNLHLISRFCGVILSSTTIFKMVSELLHNLYILSMIWYTCKIIAIKPFPPSPSFLLSFEAKYYPFVAGK